MPKTNQSPGSYLLGMLDKYQLNCNRLSKEIKCSQTALRLISLDKSRITTSIAVRLAKFFGTTTEFWLLAQMNYDIKAAAKNKKLAKQLSGISTAGKVSLARKTKKPAAKAKKAGKVKKAKRAKRK